MLISRMIGTGSYVPDRVVSNEELAGVVGLSPEAIVRRTGIGARHWVSAEQTTADLAEQAARRACQAAGIEPSSLDLVVLSTTSPDMAFPSTACLLGRSLGARGAAAFDVAASCSGFLYGLSMVDGLLRSGRYRRGLVVAAEVKSRCLDLRDTSTAILFGDGAGAAVVTADRRSPGKATGIQAIRLAADGARHRLIRIPAGGSVCPTTDETVRTQQHTLRMDGAALYRVAIRHLARAVADLMKEFGLGIADIGQVIFHQANARLLASLRTRLGIPAERFWTVIDQVGNVSSASLPIALDRAARQGRISAGDRVLLGAFGGGVTWATGLIRW